MQYRTARPRWSVPCPWGRKEGSSGLRSPPGSAQKWLERASGAWETGKEEGPRGAFLPAAFTSPERQLPLSLQLTVSG